MEGENRIGDIGTVITVTIMEGASVVDISSATTKNILIKRSDKSLLTKEASFATDGTDGKLQYTTVDGDFNEKGKYCIQGLVVLPSGTWRTDIEDFEVYPNLTAG